MTADGPTCERCGEEPAATCKCNAPEVSCGCSELLAGVLWPCGRDGDTSLPFAQRCDGCRRFPDDDAAAEALAEKIGGVVAWAVSRTSCAYDDDGKPLGDDRDHLAPFVIAPKTVPAIRAGAITTARLPAFKRWVASTGGTFYDSPAHLIAAVCGDKEERARPDW